MSDIGSSGGGDGGKVIVTYSANSALLASPLTEHFVKSLSYQLPLRTLHWRPGPALAESSNCSSIVLGRTPAQNPSGTVIRTIQTLDVSLRPLTDEIKRWRGDPGFFDQPSSSGLLDRPFVHLYLVVCDDNDHYRTTVRNEIRSWISSLSFFHSKSAQASRAGSAAASSSTPTSGPSRNSFGFGSFRSATPPVRSNTAVSGSGSGAASSTTPSGTPTGARTNSLPPAAATSTQDPEYIIVVINPPEGYSVGGAAGTGQGAAGTSSSSSSSSTAETKSGMGRFYSKSRGSVVDKIKTDFNASKKEHVVHLTRLPPVPSLPARPGAHANDPTVWAELLVRLKEGAASTFTSTVDAQQDEIGRCEGSRGQADWDFCSHFLAKDALAQTLEGVGLREDAVAQYEDLEAVFEQAMLGGNVAFAPVGGDTPGDDSLPLLEVAKKPYHELIRSREITLFDFRCYLFARRASLLGKLGRVVQVMRGAPLFIGTMRQMLDTNPRVTRRMVESWSFSAALDVVEQCQAWLVEWGDAPMGPGSGQRSRLEGRLAMAVTSSTVVEEQLSPVFHTAKAELLDLARRQLDRIGMAVGHLPKVEPFLLSADDKASRPWARDLPPLPPDASKATAGDEQQITRPELKQAIEDRGLFDSHYVSLVERVITGLSSGGRRGSVLRMQTLLAALDYHRHRFDKAYAALVSLPELYHDPRWSSIEGHLLARQLECHRQLQKPRDRAWVSVVLAALRASEARTLLPASELDVAQASEGRLIELWQDPRFLLQELRQAATSFEREVPVGGNRAFAIHPISRRARLVGTEDGSTIEVAVFSSLGFELAVEDVRLCFVGERKQALWFTSGRTRLQAGLTRLDLFCSSPAHGLFALDVSQIRLARLIFQYATPPLGPIASSLSSSSASFALASPSLSQAQAQPSSFLLSIPKDGSAIDADVDLPREIHLDRPREVELALSSGRNDIESAEVSILTSDGEPVGDLGNVQLVDGDSGARVGEVEPAAAGGGSTIWLLGQAARTVARVRFPLIATSQDGGVDVVVVVHYVTRPQDGARTSVRRTLRKHSRLTISLPLGVNLQDYFRQSSLFSKFVVSTGGTASLRIKSARLAVDDRHRAAPEQGGGVEEAAAEAAAAHAEENGLEVTSCGSTRTTTVTPHQPASYLFRIQRRQREASSAADGERSAVAGAGAAPSPLNRSLCLELRYRPLHEEAKAIALRALAKQIAASKAAATEDTHLEPSLSLPSSSINILLQRALVRYVDARLDRPAFSLTGEIKTGAFDGAWWKRERKTWPSAVERDGKANREAIKIVAATLDSISDACNVDDDDLDDDDETWRLLTIPVEVPSMSIINSLTLRIDPLQSSARPSPRAGIQATIVVGQPVDVDVKIKTSFLWSDPVSLEGKRQQRFTYDVSVDFDNWLVSGMKRACFTVPLPTSSTDLQDHDDDDTVETNFKIQLVPLRSGYLTLPSVVVRPVDPALTRTPRSVVSLRPPPPPPPPATDKDHVEQEQGYTVPSCESYTTNGAERVEVVPRLNRTTVWLDTTSFLHGHDGGREEVDLRS